LGDVWEEYARAKINLTLDVLGLREDGYHEVEMIMQTVDLCDRLKFRSRSDEQITIQTNLPYLPVDERNLVYRAAALLRDHCGVKQGVHIDIVKHIPVAAGLAGGSSDAAATLRALNGLWQLGLSVTELTLLGASIGSDVPFCLRGGTALATGRGERIQPLPDALSIWVVLAKPPLSVSTADVYRNYRNELVQRRPDTGRMLHALQLNKTKMIGRELGNVLESVTFAMHPEVARLKRRMLRFGASAALMSGSGPTVFALADREHRARRVYNSLRGYMQSVYLCRFVGRIDEATVCLRTE